MIDNDVRLLHNRLSARIDELQAELEKIEHELRYLDTPASKGGGGGIDVEVDPTVPSWAKQPNKPTYTAAEVHALPDTTVIPTVPTVVSAFTNDAGYITGYTETDPTVPSWAKAASKPTYTASEVGAFPVGDNVALQKADSSFTTKLQSQTVTSNVVLTLPAYSGNLRTIEPVEALPATAQEGQIFLLYGNG